MTSEQIKLLADSWRIDCPDDEAARHAGITPEALAEALRTDPNLAKVKQQIQDSLIREARRIYADNFKKDPKLAENFLKRKLPEEFADRRVITTPDKKPLEIRIINFDK